MGKRMTDTDRDNIVALHYAFGLNTIEIAKATGYSDGSVSNVLSTIELVKGGKERDERISSL